MLLIPLLISAKIEISILYYISKETIQIESLCPSNFKANSGYCELDPGLKLLSSGVINIHQCLDDVCFEGFSCLIENSSPNFKTAHVSVTCTQYK